MSNKTKHHLTAATLFGTLNITTLSVGQGQTQSFGFQINEISPSLARGAILMPSSLQRGNAFPDT
jgi:hypothetical protein